MSHDVLVLPVQGDPLTRVWVPKSREQSGLKAEIKLSDTGSSAAHRRRAALGLTAGVRIVCVLPDNSQLWVAWVLPGETPQGFDELTAAEAADSTFGPLVRKVQEALARQ